MIDTTKSLLLQQRDRILRLLVDLAAQDRKKEVADTFRKQAEFLVSELAAAQDMLSRIGEDQDKAQYAHCRRAIDGVLMIFEELERPLSEDEITKRLIKGGFRGGVPGTGIIIHKSLKNFLGGTGKSKGLIKKVGGLIGLSEWDNSRFKA